MAWCTCPKIIISFILGVIFLFGVAPSSNEPDLFSFLAYFLLFYAMVGAVYKFCVCCANCCHNAGSAFNRESNDRLIDNS
jgi:hypothetical protein